MNTSIPHDQQPPADEPPGAAFLDRHGPEQWHNKINTDILDMQHIRNCVLGQLFGGYIDGLHTLDIDEHITLGFAIEDQRMLGREREAKWAQLTNAWKRAIYRRQSGARI